MRSTVATTLVVIGTLIANVSAAEPENRATMLTLYNATSHHVSIEVRLREASHSFILGPNCYWPNAAFFGPPEDDRVVTAHVLKADGSTMKPEQVAGISVFNPPASGNLKIMLIDEASPWHSVLYSVSPAGEPVGSVPFGDGDGPVPLGGQEEATVKKVYEKHKGQLSKEFTKVSGPPRL